MIYLKLLDNKELKVNKTNPLFEGENNVDSIKINISERWKDFTCFLNIITEKEKQGDLFIISSDTEYLIPKEFLSKEQNLIIFIEMRKENDVVAKSTPILIKVDSHQNFEDVIEDVEISAFNQILEQAVVINQDTLQIKKDIEDMLDKIENPAEEIEQLRQELETKAPLNSPNFKDSAYINDIKILTTEDKDIIDEDLLKINTSLNQEIDRAKSVEAQLNEKIDKKTTIDISSSDSSIVVNNNKIGVQISEKEENNLSLESDGLFVKKPEEYSIVKNNDNTYCLTKNGKPTGDSILIPKDLVVKSGRVQDDKLILILNNEEETEITIDVSDLIEYVTSGSDVSDAIQIIIDSDHKVSAQILESSISKDKLSAEIKKSLNLADSSVQSQDIEKKEDNINKVKSIDVDSDDVQYPSAKAVYQFGTSLAEDLSTTMNQFKDDLSQGEIVVSNATYAEEATNAFYSEIAYSDGDGQNISMTYAKIQPDIYSTIHNPLVPNTTYMLGIQSVLELSFPSTAASGDVIYVEFESSESPTNLIIDATNIYDFELIPEANTVYEVYGKYNGKMWMLGYSEYVG